MQSGAAASLQHWLGPRLWSVILLIAIPARCRIFDSRVWWIDHTWKGALEGRKGLLLLTLSKRKSTPCLRAIAKSFLYLQKAKERHGGDFWIVPEWVLIPCLAGEGWKGGGGGGYCCNLSLCKDHHRLSKIENTVARGWRGVESCSGRERNWSKERRGEAFSRL